MRIALASTVAAVVQPEARASVEGWIWLMSRELTRSGHQVTVFGCAGATLDGELVATVPGPYGEKGAFDDWQLCEWVNLSRAVAESGRFDLLHAQAYLWGIPLQPMARCPVLHTVHIVPDDNAAKLWRSAPHSHVSALSRHQWSAYPDLQPTAVIPHGVDLQRFTFQETPSDYLLYFGRFISGKGPLQAIQLARTLGIKLVLAGPENAFFRERIKPLVDGRTVDYAGYVQGPARSQLLGGARALLYPIQYPEPFGLVLVEAMLCGTPVAAINLGAVPEIVDDGVTGFLAKHLDQLPQCLSDCFKLDRRRIRLEAERRFSAERMARDYVRCYEKIA